MLLQILEDGRCSHANGKVANFANTAIIMRWDHRLPSWSTTRPRITRPAMTGVMVVIVPSDPFLPMYLPTWARAASC
jgi:hypothetical protein